MGCPAHPPADDAAGIGVRDEEIEKLEEREKEQPLGCKT